MNTSDPVHLPIYTPGPLPSIRCRAPGEVDQGYRMLDRFYAQYKRLVLPELLTDTGSPCSDALRVAPASGGAGAEGAMDERSAK